MFWGDIMEKINIGSFYIEEYDAKNIDHKSTLVRLSNQEDFKYIGELDWLEDEFRTSREKGERDTLNIAYIGDVPVGIIGFNVIKDEYQLMIAILPEFRGQRYSSRLALEYARFLFKQYPEIPNVHAAINKNNLISIKSAKREGFLEANSSMYNTNYVLNRGR